MRRILLPTAAFLVTIPTLVALAQNNGQFTLNQGTADASASSGHDAPDPSWKLTWSDDFKGPAIDTTKWDFEIDGKGGGNGEKEYYTGEPANAHIESDGLHITAIKDGKDAEGKTHAFTSARMTTKGKFFQQYGRFEACIKCPHGQGVWPAFWLMPEDAAYGGWAASGELDIMELIGKNDNTTWGTIHYGAQWPKNVHTGSKLALPSGIMADDFHIFSVEWQPGVIRWYFDNKLYETQTKWYTKGGNNAPFPAPFDKPFFVILNFAVGGAWPGPPNADTVFPQDMIVKYVHVYAAPETPGASTASTTSSAPSSAPFNPPPM